MRLYVYPVLLPLLCGLLPAASPGITPHTADSDVTAQTSVKNTESAADNSVVLYNLSLSGLKAQELRENITLDSPLHLKLTCNLQRESTDLQIFNVTWKHGEEEVSSDRYTYNSTESQLSTTLDILVNDKTDTGDYTCIFTPATDANATFHIAVPAVHGGGKTLVSYDGDSIVLKCDSYNYKPLQWAWYKINETDTVLLNFSSECKKYKLENKGANETKLHISDLTENDNAAYVCKADFGIGESEGRMHINVLSLMAPLKVFLAIVAEVVILVAIILGVEVLTKKKKNKEDDIKENEQTAHLETEENNTSENSTRQRKA